jgi:hypothetical protein
MAMIVGTPPKLPIRLRWDDIDTTYDTLEDIGVDLQFVQERDYVTSDESEPNFADVSGERFRILVISLEVVLCVAVPADFDSRQLELAEIRDGDRWVLAEHLRGEIHRVLSAPNGLDQPIAAVSVDELEGVGSRDIRDAVLAQTDCTWQDFDELWYSAVDPAPPIVLGQALRRLVSRVFRWGSR